jgi:hypothetical protein
MPLLASEHASVDTSRQTTTIPRELTDGDRDLIAAARAKAFVLYEGRRVPHRSCGVALAETFNLPTRPYQSLRRGGVTGEGECGAIKAGELIIGEFLGDPDPTGPVTPSLRAAAIQYRDAWRRRVDLGPAGPGGSIVCNVLTSPFHDFRSEERQSFCTNIAASVAEIVAEILLRFGATFEITAIQGLSDQGESSPQGAP